MILFHKDIKKRIIKAIIWSVALYAAETWTYRKEDIRRLEAFEMWVWRKVEKISWRDMKTNEEVLQIVQEERSLMDVICRRKKKMDWSYTQRRKPSEGGDRGSDDRKKTKGKETIGYAERVTERIVVVCGTKEKGRKQERVENMEAKNLPHGRTLTTTPVIIIPTPNMTCNF